MIDSEHQVHETSSASTSSSTAYPIVARSGTLARRRGFYDSPPRTSEFLDAFTCFASWPLGLQPPGLRRPGLRTRAPRGRPSARTPPTADLYTVEMAAFVDAFATVVTPPDFPHHFWIAGGSLAVENALKVAFDWKARKLGRTRLRRRRQRPGDAPLQAGVPRPLRLHDEPDEHAAGQDRALPEVRLAARSQPRHRLRPRRQRRQRHRGGGGGPRRARDRGRRSRRARQQSRRRIIIEPMQGEGGDNHFRPEFLQRAARVRDEHEALLIFDEVQTGFYGSRQARGCGSTRASPPTSSPSARRLRSAASTPTSASTRCLRTSSAAPAGSTRRGAATSWTWFALAVSSRSSRDRTSSRTSSTRGPE